MVANNKNSTSEVTVTKPSPQPGNAGKSDKFRITRKRLLTYLILVVIAVTGTWLWVGNGLHVGQKVYAQAAGHKIYKKDIQNLIGETKGISDRQAATVLADKYLVEAMAQENEVTVTNQDIEAAYGTDINKQKTSDPYAYQNKVNQLYFAKLSTYNTGMYKGQLLVTNFSRNIAYRSPLLEQKRAANPSIGNPTAIAIDKKYAQDLINKLYNQVQSGEITFEEAAQIERNDQEVGEKAYPTLPHSGVFDTLSKSRRNSLIETASIRQKIHGMQPGQTSKPFVVSVSNSINDDSMAESYFLVVKIDTSAGGNSSVSFEEEITQAKQKLDYKIYV